uniref:CSON005454 protein n=1 Tax=Culicoides sonorensis TaxID=179676 RepID=A0A336KDH1_CULSO
MEVAIGNTPFQTQVHEWQQHHPSPVAEANPIENHWIKGSFNTYGKMVTNNFLTPDGTKHTQKKQMEILQARTKEGGALQVVKSTTSQSMSSRTISLSSSNTNTLGIGSMSAAERPSSLSLKTMNTSPILNSSYNSNEKWNGNRAKSQSNEDLVQQNDDSDLEMNQAWNRISRIRRSFQYPSPCSSTARTNTRPLDFPTKISVDVNKIRQELESICGANKGDKASPNDDGEFVALDSILKGANVEKSENMKKKEIVTAETLLDIRNSLRRLEDESLYKDTVLNSPRNSLLLDNDHSKINYSNASPSVRSSFGNWRSKLLNNEISPSNSLLRRKSYAFERLEQQDDKMESSTDSGLGRSSPTTDRKRNSLLAISRSKLSPTRITLFNDSHLISLPKSSKFSMPTTLSTGSRFDFEGRTSIHINGHNEDDSSSQDGILDENGKKSTKRVEFCKTEVHFTPDSGRVNIVESEAKPPPTNNFRRRRRVSSSTCSVSSANSNKSVTDSTQFCRYGEKNEVNITPELIMNDVSDYSGDSNSFNNYLDQVEDMSIRGILKNKPVKPRRYLLGENMKDTDSIWGVKLNPIYNEDENISQNDAIDAKSDKNTSKVNDFGYSTKIDFTFKDDTGTWNEGAPAKKVLSRSYNSSFVEYKKPDSSSLSQSTGLVLAPEQELKSISLVKNTIKLGDSLNKFKIIGTEAVKPEKVNMSEKSNRIGKFDTESLSNFKSGFSPISLSSHSQKNEINNEIQLRKDLDEAFKDLMNVSETLKEMGRITDCGSREQINKNPVVVKQYNTFPSIKSNNSLIHSISTINSNNWTTISSQKQLNTNESLSDVGCETYNNLYSKVKPIPKPRQIFKLNQRTDAFQSPSPEKVIHSPIDLGGDTDQGIDTVDLLGHKQKANFVKTIQMQFEALTLLKASQDSNSEYLNSNKLSIELYSPTNSLDRNTVKSEKPKKRPVPIPRTIMSDSEGVVKPSRIIAKSKAFEQLALKSGARQLKPTELVYFGILANNNQNSSNYDQKNSTNQHRNSNPSSPLLTRISKSYVSPSNQTFQIQQKYSQDGIRSNDVSPVNDYFYNTSFERPSSQKPSSDVFEKSYNESYNSDTMSSNTSTIERINKFEKTIRENLIGNVSLEKKSYVRLSPKVKSRSEMLGLGLKESSVDFDVDQYDRSQDYKRDEKVLAELTRAADDIMNTIKKMDEEETRRKSRSHHHQQYMEVMETINEKPTQTARPSLSSASSQESISSLRKSPGRQTINRIPLRRNSIESKTETVPKQTSSKTSTSTRECRRILRTASREVVNSSSEDLAKDTIKTDPPRRVRRIKVINENQSQVDHSESKPKDKISNKKQDSKSRSNSSRNKVYTHRLKKVDDISMKPTSSSNSKRYTSKSRASSSSIRSSKTSL